jgi:hypothetical protein
MTERTSAIRPRPDRHSPPSARRRLLTGEQRRGVRRPRSQPRSEARADARWVTLWRETVRQTDRLDRRPGSVAVRGHPPRAWTPHRTAPTHPRQSPEPLRRAPEILRQGSLRVNTAATIDNAVMVAGPLGALGGAEREHDRSALALAVSEVAADRAGVAVGGRVEAARACAAAGRLAAGGDRRARDAAGDDRGRAPPLRARRRALPGVAVDLRDRADRGLPSSGRDRRRAASAAPSRSPAWPGLTRSSTSRARPAAAASSPGPARRTFAGCHGRGPDAPRPRPRVPPIPSPRNTDAKWRHFATSVRQWRRETCSGQRPLA